MEVKNTSEAQRGNRIRYHADEIIRNTYYQLQKFLFKGEFKGMSNDARVLYSLLRDRHELSLKNKWINEDGEVYLIFSRDEMIDMLGVSENTVLKAMNALKKNGLVEEERQGLGKPNIIYLLMAESVENTQTRRICGSRSANSAGQEPENLRPINTYIKQTELSYTQKQQTGENPESFENPQHAKDQNRVVVSEQQINVGNRDVHPLPGNPEKVLTPVHKPKKAMVPDVSCLAFIMELSDVDKLNILKKAGNDIPNIQAAYDVAQQQGGIDSLTAFIISMVGKLQRGEVSPPVSIKQQVKQNRFVNFEQRDIDFEELERLERELLKQALRK